MLLEHEAEQAHANQSHEAGGERERDEGIPGEPVMDGPADNESQEHALDAAQVIPLAEIAPQLVVGSKEQKTPKTADNAGDNNDK